MSNTTVYGIYRDTVSLGGGLERLRTAGFRSTDVSVLMPENIGTKDFVHKKDTKAPEGATTGGVSGGVVGGLLGGLIGAGIPEYEAKRYEGRVKSGGILLSVHCDSSEWVKRAKT